MPIYEYECDKCGHAFEREQRMSDAPVKTCPKCKGRKVTKLISQTSFVLKGSGWYADGYSDPKKKTTGSDSDSDSSKSESSSTSSDKKDGGGEKAKGKPKDKSSKKGSSKSAA